MQKTKPKKPKLTKEQQKEVFVLTPPFKVSWPNVFEPKAWEDGQQPKYSVTMLFKNKDDLKELQRAEKNALKHHFGADPKRWPKEYNRPFRSGNPEFPVEKGMIVVKASSTFAPQVLDQRKNQIRKEDDTFYAGCMARATLVANYWKSPLGQGVNFYLQNLQKVGDGDRIGGGPSAQDQFDEVEDGSDDVSSYEDTDDAEEESEDDDFGF